MHRNTTRTRLFSDYRFHLQRVPAPICSTRRSSPSAAMNRTTHRVLPNICLTTTRAYMTIIKSTPEESIASTQTLVGRGDFTKAVKWNAAYKERSHRTHYKTHVPEIQSRLEASGPRAEDGTPRRIGPLGSSSLERFETTGESVRTVLLGDSMFERFKTTGELHHSCGPNRILRCSRLDCVLPPMPSSTPTFCLQITDRLQFPHLLSIPAQILSTSASAVTRFKTSFTECR